MYGSRNPRPPLPRALAGLLGAVLAAAACWIAKPFGKDREVQALPQEGTALPAVMYHNVLPDGSGGLGDYVISAPELEGDLQFLRDAGYTGVTPREVFDAVRGVGSLPEHPVLLTFDDGFESMEQVVLPLLRQYGFRAAAAIVGEYTDLYSGDVPRQLSYSHLSWDQARALEESGLVEIASHTYALHSLEGRKGMKKRPGETPEAYRRALSEDLLLLQEKCRDHLRREPAALVYPYGFYNRETEDLARELGFSLTLTCEEGVSVITDKESLFGLKRWNRPHGADRQEFFQKMGICGSR